MRTACLSLLMVFCCIFSNEANQADQLRKFIKSQRSSTSPQNAELVPVLGSSLSSSVGTSYQNGTMKADEIKRLPGQPKGIHFKQYAGYVTVDPKHGRALFYYFVQSARTPAKKPLVLWLNGGPGCSSLGFGAMKEIGPFRVNRDGKTLSKNYFSWNNVANVIFLESPAGVGFSYSNTTSDYDESGDKQTTEDSYTFLINWLERFPQYKSHDLYITGESFAGHFIPELAYFILQNNKLPNRTFINLRGLAVGNPYMDVVSNNIGKYEFYWKRALIADETYASICSNCNFSSNIISDECDAAQTKADYESGDIDFYNIYARICPDSSSSTGSSIMLKNSDPCLDDYVNSYLNSPKVQIALHANVTTLPYRWEHCTRRLSRYNAPESVISIIKQLIDSGIRLWLYSGDVDGVVPETDTKHIIKILNLPIKNSWRAWYVGKEVGGYIEEYDGLTFVTVRGAGHEVPSDQPERALIMISFFLKGKLPPLYMKTL